MRTGQRFLSKNQAGANGQKRCPQADSMLSLTALGAHCLEVIVAPEPEKELTLPVMAEHPFPGRSEDFGTGGQIKEPDKPFNSFPELKYIDS